MSNGGKGAGKGGSAGHATNAALDDSEDILARRKVLFGKWKGSQKSRAEVHPAHMIDYSNSPRPPQKKM